MTSPAARLDKRIERAEQAHRSLRDAAVNFSARNRDDWSERTLMEAARKYSNTMRRLARGSKA